MKCHLSVRIFSAQNTLTMAFLIRIKLNNIFRSISFSEIESNMIGDDNEQMVDAIIKKGEIEVHTNNK